MKNNYYSAPKGFLINPLNSLYHTPDVEISQDEAIQELIQYGRNLEYKIPGDFDLSNIILEFKNNTFSFVKTGLLMYKVKVLKLYKKTYSNFKDFCKSALKVSHWQINRTVEASRIVFELIQAGFEILPRNVAQCGPLSSFTGEELIEKWEEIVENIDEHRITAKSIDETINPPEREEKIKTEIKLPPKLYLSILKVAIAKDMSIVELLEEVFLYNDSFAYLSDEEQKGANLHLKSWEEDLDELVRTHLMEVG